MGQTRSRQERLARATRRVPREEAERAERAEERSDVAAGANAATKRNEGGAPYGSAGRGGPRFGPGKSDVREQTGLGQVRRAIERGERDLAIADRELGDRRVEEVPHHVERALLIEPLSFRDRGRDRAAGRERDGGALERARRLEEARHARLELAERLDLRVR